MEAELREKLKSLGLLSAWHLPVEEVQPEDLWKWKVYGDWPCFKCRYNLKGLQGPEVTCPECGQNNDLRRFPLWKKTASPQAIAWLVDVGWCLLISIVFVCFLLCGLGSLLVGQWVATIVCLSIAFILLVFWFRNARLWLSLIPSRKLGCLLFFVVHATGYLILFGLGAVTYHFLFDWHSLWISISLLVTGLIGYGWTYRRLKRMTHRQQHTMTWASWPIDARTL